MNGIAQPTRSPRRVRHEVRDGMAVMAFSAGASCLFALVLLLLVSLLGGAGNQG